MSRLPHSVKWPLESRVWFKYPDQANGLAVATGSVPTQVARVVDGGATQLWQSTVNDLGHTTSITDPLGRQTTYIYDTNQIDLLEVRQTGNGANDVLAVFDDYTSGHQPQTVTDAAGAVTTLTYNTAGQVLTVTNAASQTTTSVYDTDGFLQSVTGPVSGSQTTYGYDGYGRVATVTGPDGYAVDLEHDALGRTTKVTYPDDTFEQVTYEKLHVKEQRDRLGRMTTYFHDAAGRPTAVRDAAGRTVQYDWCRCADLNALIDAKGQRTTWTRDVHGRVTTETRADGTTTTGYTYQPLTGRLATVTDPKAQVTTYTYNLDDSLASTGFTNETIATADLSHTYDTQYARPATMVDGHGTTTYTYKEAGTLGAGQLATVDGPLTSDTLTYTYDQLGRVATRLLNGTGTELTYDTLGRLSALEFPIGQFDYTYDGHTGRVATVTYPNAQTSTYSYLGHAGDHRLQTIHHKNPSAATLSKFDYTYDPVGNILTWRQERTGAAAKIHTFAHDGVDQLTSAVLTDTNTTPAILKRQARAYDPAGNRTVDQNDDAVFATTHDTMNRLQARAPGGPIVLSGVVNEAATVTIDGRPASADASNNFRGTAQVASGTTTVTVKAKDPTGNETTQQYEIDAAGSTTSYTYDANGNLTSDGTKTYFWNALNQLVEVKEGTTTIASFEYDGEGRRTEKVAAGLTHQYIYDAEDIVEERISGTSSDTIRYYHGAGIDEPLARKNSSDVVTYYLADHLGSIVQETGSSGVESLARSYDAWGVLIDGNGTSGYAFTGREWDAEIGLYYYRARYYASMRGEFLSQDPIGFASGDTNFAVYVRSGPLSNTDPTGLNVYPNGFKVSPELLVVLNKMNKEMFPNEDIIVTGGDRYVDAQGNIRSSTDNSIVRGSARRSSHIDGTAVDFRVTNTPDFIAEQAAKQYFDWTSSDYPNAPHVHGDLRNKMAVRACRK